MSMNAHQRIAARLRPLYVAAFFQGFVLWYPIEKVFMHQIGFNDAGIGGMIAFYSAVMLLAETPSGILADRWSRKGVLVLASIALTLSAFMGGISTNPAMFLASAGLWGIFFALYSGTYESIVYDTILEENAKSDRYEHYYGRISSIDSVALVIGSICGGLAAQHLGLRSTFFITMPMSLLAIVALAKFREPRLHKSQEIVSIRRHVTQTFKAVLHRGQLMPVMIVLIADSVLSYLAFEFSQLWIIALGTPLLLFGPLNALQLSTVGLGSMSASRFGLQRYRRMLLVLLALTLGSLGLIFFRTLPLIIVSLDILCVCVIALRIIFGRLLHDSLSSTVRAGAASAVSTVGRVIIIPVSLLFGYLSERADVFAASWILFLLVGVIIVFTIKTYSKTKELPNFIPEDRLSIETYNK